MSPTSSARRPDLCIPHPVVVKDKEMGRRPKLTVNDKLRARG